MRTKRKGIAIVAALGGIVVIGALVAGVFFVSTQENQISGGALVQERAFRAAELGLNTTLANWDKSAMYALSTGDIRTFAYAGSDWVDTVRVTKLTPLSYSLLSTATTGAGRLARSRKSTQLTVRLSVPNFNFLGALTTRGPTTITGSSIVDGNNTIPATWTDCPAVGDALAGVATAKMSDVSVSGNSTVAGNPTILEDPAAGQLDTYFVYGDETWESLTAAADIVVDGGATFSQINPVVTNGVCDKSVKTNWGSPQHETTPNACESYFPIIHAKGEGGSLTLSGNRGQGILLVDGDLEITGNFEFYGPVIVKGELRATGTGTKLNGAVMSANVLLDDQKTAGNSTVTYSSCAIEKARGGAASPRRIRQRAWTQVH